MFTGRWKGLIMYYCQHKPKTNVLILIKSQASSLLVLCSQDVLQKGSEEQVRNEETNQENDDLQNTLNETAERLRTKLLTRSKGDQKSTSIQDLHVNCITWTKMAASMEKLEEQEPVV